MNNTTRTITITSGKGGVGKTNISLNLALELSKQGYKSCVFDADLGLANINILLGLSPENDLGDVIDGQCSLMDILIKNFEGIDIIPGSSGVEKLASLNEKELANLTSSLVWLNKYDFLIFDTSAGISPNTIAFCLASSEVLLVVTPEPTSMTDAYALLKVLDRNQFKGAARVVVNQCKDIKTAQIIYNSFKEAVNRYLSVNVNLTGIIVQDPNLIEAVKKQQPFLLLYPKTNASRCIRHMAKILLGKKPPEFDLKGVSSFWDQYLSILRNPINTKGIQTGSDGSDSASMGFPINIPAEKKGSGDVTDLKIEGNQDLDFLVKGVLDISNELSRIRILLENNKSSEFMKIDQATVAKYNNRWGNAIELNFDDYSKKHQIFTE
ncbi:MinD/ParA family protein [Thermodesulfobacteriota bacterium]